LHAIVMPNLKPPVTTTEAVAAAYRDHILEDRGFNRGFLAEWQHFAGQRSESAAARFSVGAEVAVRVNQVGRLPVVSLVGTKKVWACR